MNSVNIYLEANPNPNSLKFVADRMLLDDKVIKDYPDSKSAGDSLIARELFKFDYVERVFIMSNFNAFLYLILAQKRGENFY